MVGMVLTQEKSQRSLRSELAVNSFSSNHYISVCKIFNKIQKDWWSILCYHLLHWKSVRETTTIA